MNVSSIDIEVDIEFVFIIASRQVRWLHSVICDAHPIIAVAVTITITITFLPQIDEMTSHEETITKSKEKKWKEKKRKPEQMGNRTASRKKSEKKRKITFNLFHISLCVPPA